MTEFRDDKWIKDSKYLVMSKREILWKWAKQKSLRLILLALNSISVKNADDFTILPWSHLHLCAQSVNSIENILESSFKLISEVFFFPYEESCWFALIHFRVLSLHCFVSRLRMALTWSSFILEGQLTLSDLLTLKWHPQINRNL